MRSHSSKILSIGVPCDHGYLGWHKVEDGVPSVICKEGRRTKLATYHLAWALGRTDVDRRSSLYVRSRLRDGEERLRRLLADANVKGPFYHAGVES